MKPARSCLLPAAPTVLLLAVCLAGCQSYYRKVGAREHPETRQPAFSGVTQPPPQPPTQPPPPPTPTPPPPPNAEPKPTPPEPIVIPPIVVPDNR